MFSSTMFADWRSRDGKGRLLIAMWIVAAAIVAAAALLLLDKQEPTPQTDPAKEPPGRQVEQMYQEDLARARASALANEAARQAELDAAAELVNSMDNHAVGVAPPEVEVLPTEDLAQFAPVPSGAPGPPPEPAVPPGSVRTKEGQIVDVEALIRSVRAAEAKGNDSD